MANVTFTTSSDASYNNTITFAGTTFSRNTGSATLSLGSGQVYQVIGASDQGSVKLRAVNNCVQFEDSNDNDFNDLIVCASAGSFYQSGDAFYYQAPFEAPVITYFYVNKQDGSRAEIGNVPYGQSVTMFWSATTNVTSVSIVAIGETPAGAPVPPNPALTGSYTFTPPSAGTYTYRLTATGPAGSVTGDYGFIVSQPPLPTVSISLSKSSIVKDGVDSATLSWSASGTAISSVTVTGQVNPANTGSATVRPTVTTTYVITATNPAGTSRAEVTLTVTLPPPPTVSISLNKTSIINNGTDSATLSWSVSGVNISSITVTDQANPGTSGSVTVRPTSSRTYSITATNEGGTTTRTVTLTVYQPPRLTLTLSRNPIIVGESTTLSWSTTGDASTITWTSGGITNGNLTSSQSVSPGDDTTYSATVSGPGGTFSASVTLQVYQRPTVTLTAPTTLNYGQQGTISYTSTYANVSIILYTTYTYYIQNSPPLTQTITANNITLTKASSAKLNAVGSSVSGTLNTNIPYNDLGPVAVRYFIEAIGNGGTASQTSDLSINIDKTPENIIIPDTKDKFKDEDPVYTPDVEVVSEVLEVTDVDIPVEIKSNFPIKVKVNDGNWTNIRQL